MTALRDVIGFAEFVAEKQRPLLRLAMVLYGGARQSEDIVADVLGRAYEKWTHISTLDQPYAYVQRTTLVLRYFESLSDAGIAQVLACSESTVRSNAARALAALRISLTPLTNSGREF